MLNAKSGFNYYGKHAAAFLQSENQHTRMITDVETRIDSTCSTNKLQACEVLRVASCGCDISDSLHCCVMGSFSFPTT